MRKLSSVFYMWVGFGCAAVATLCMFLPFLSREGGSYNAIPFFYNGSFGTFENGAWASLLGFMLILAGGIALAVIALPFIQPSAKVEKIVLISSIAALVIGTVLALMLKPLYCMANDGVSYALGSYLVGFYFTLILSLLAIASAVIALLLDW